MADFTKAGITRARESECSTNADKQIEETIKKVKEHEHQELL
jgi:hypothetical protein